MERRGRNRRNSTHQGVVERLDGSEICACQANGDDVNFVPGVMESTCAPNDPKGFQCPLALAVPLGDNTIQVINHHRHRHQRRRRRRRRRHLRRHTATPTQNIRTTCCTTPGQRGPVFSPHSPHPHHFNPPPRFLWFCSSPHALASPTSQVIVGPGNRPDCQGHALRATSKILQLPTPASDTPVTVATTPGQRFVALAHGPAVALLVTAAVIAQHNGRDHLWLGTKLPDDPGAYIFRYRRKHLGDADPRDELWEEMHCECPNARSNEDTACISSIACSKDGERVFFADLSAVSMMRLNRAHPEYHDLSHVSAVEDASDLSKYFECGNVGLIAAVALSPDNRMYSGSMSGHIAIWDNGAHLIDGPDVFAGSPDWDFDQLGTAYANERLSALVTDADGRLYSAGHTTRGISVWDTSEAISSSRQ